MKTFTSQALAALEAGDAIEAAAVRLALPTPFRAWGGEGELTLGGETYLGVGSRGLVKTFAGSIGAGESATEIQLSGVEAEALDMVRTAPLRGAPVLIWWLIFSSSGTELLNASVFLRGQVDRKQIAETPGGASSISLFVEGAARGLGRRRARLRTDVDQRRITATDGGFGRVSFAGEKTLNWGGKPPQRAGEALPNTAAAVSQAARDLWK